jgi:hypothetical protein
MGSRSPWIGSRRYRERSKRCTLEGSRKLIEGEMQEMNFRREAGNG